MTPRLRNLLRDYASQAMNANELSVQLMDYGYEIEAVPDEDRQVVLDIENALAAFTSGHIDETEIGRVVNERLYPPRLAVIFSYEGPAQSQSPVTSVQSSSSARALQVQVAA